MSSNKKELTSEENIVSIKIKTIYGERAIDYKKVTVDSKYENVCKTKCPYYSNKLNCRSLRNPRDPENKKSCFMMFCLGNAPDDLKNNFYVPVKGTIRKNFGDIIIKNKEED